MSEKNVRTSLMLIACGACAAGGLLFFSALNGDVKVVELEDPPVITSATYQHTLYNGRSQPIEATAAKDDTPPFVITYFSSEENLEQDFEGKASPPSEVGNYYARIARPAGNGYRQGRDVKVEYHIQKAMVDIKADAKQRFSYDGHPKAASASTEIISLDGGRPEALELRYTYFAEAGENPLPGPPSQKGVYRVLISYAGSAYYMGASKEIFLIIE